MENYISLINAHRPTHEELEKIEIWWIARIREYFSAKPYKITTDPSVSLKTAFVRLFELAEKRQRENPGTMYLGALYQHLVAAKLSIALKDQQIEAFGFSVSDAQRNRAGDFKVGDSAIHVTTAPTEALLEKCRENIEHGLRPIVITSGEGRKIADYFSRQLGLEDSVEIIELEQFMITNIHEWSGFSSGDRKNQLHELVLRYNAVIDAHEGDPSMKIEL